MPQFFLKLVLLVCFYDFDLKGRFKGHLGRNVGFIPYSSIIMVNNLQTVMNSRKVYKLCLIQLIKLDIFCFYDFDLRGLFKGHLGRNVGFMAYSYIIMVNNLKTVMNLRKLYNICLMQLTKVNIFVFMTLTSEVVLKVIWAEMLVL